MARAARDDGGGAAFRHRTAKRRRPRITSTFAAAAAATATVVAVAALLLLPPAAADDGAADGGGGAAEAKPDPWKAPILGFRPLSEGKGEPSAASGGLGVVPIGPRGRDDVHVLILTDCAKYQDWQTIAAAFSWRESGQPGNVTRVVNCSPDETKAYGKVMMEVMPTFWARQYAYNQKLKDWYAAYNKPGAVVDFLEKAPAREKWVVALDSDMLLHKPFLPEEFNLTSGWAVGAAGYTYLKGVANDLAMRHVGAIAPRDDALAGPKGRRGDQVGGPYFMSTDDLRRVAPLWLSTTEEMRQDLEAWRDSGDTSFKPGKPVWISEMYGYAFGAARAGVWHRTHKDFMLYPSYTPPDIPHVIHYGLQYTVDGWEYDKHHYFDFDPFKCPPWRAWQGYDRAKLKGLAGDALAAARLAPPPKAIVDHPKEGIFPPPPHPARVANDSKPYLDRYRDLLSVFTVAQINAALCEFHAAVCPGSPQLAAVCGDAWELYLDVRDAVDAVEWSWGCADHNKECAWWAKSGECAKSAAYMADHCAAACGKCEPRAGAFAPRERAPLAFAPARPGGEEEEGGEGGGAQGQGRGDRRADGDEGKDGKGDVVVPAVKEAGAQDGAGQGGANKGGGGRGGNQRGGAGAGAAGLAAVSSLSDAQLRARYPAAAPGATFAALARRCSSAFDPPLENADLGACVRAATLKLEFMRAPAGGGGDGNGGGGNDATATATGAPATARHSLRAEQVLALGGAIEADLVAGGRRAEEAIAGALNGLSDRTGAGGAGRALLILAAVAGAVLLVGCLVVRRLRSRRGGARLPVGGGAYVQLLKPTSGHRSD